VVRAVVFQDAQVRQCSHQAEERWGMRPGYSRKIVGTFAPLRKVVGETQFGCDINNLRHPMCHSHLD
jgi:hypothetical protein